MEKWIRFGDYTITHCSKDGTRTICIFTAPLEHQTRNIRQDEAGYIRKGEFVEVRMPKVWSTGSGVCVGKEMELFPNAENQYTAICEKKENIFGQKKDCVVYKNVFGENVDFRCFATSFGVNTEIMIPEYTGDHVFELSMKQIADDLLVITDSPDYIIFRTEQELKSLVYTPLAVAADHNRSFQNRVDIQQHAAGNYTIAYVIDQAFLKHPSTKYPVTLNQSVYAYRPKQSDTAVYSQTGTAETHHLSPYMLLGDSTSKGEGWGFVRYEELYVMEIPAERIKSVQYFFQNLFDHQNEVTVGAFAIRDNWCSVNTRWDTKPQYDTLPVNTTKVKTRGIYSIDITRLFVEMLKGKNLSDPLYSVRNSFFLRCLTKGSDLLLAAGDSGIFSPYLKIILEREEKNHERIHFTGNSTN